MDAITFTQERMKRQLDDLSNKTSVSVCILYTLYNICFFGKSIACLVSNKIDYEFPTRYSSEFDYSRSEVSQAGHLIKEV